MTLRDKKFPSNANLEMYLRFGLVAENLDGKVLEYFLAWGPAELDSWFRRIFPKAFQWLDRFGELP